MRKRKLLQQNMTKIENLEKAKVPIIAYWFEFRQRQNLSASQLQRSLSLLLQCTAIIQRVQLDISDSPYLKEAVISLSFRDSLPYFRLLTSFY